MESGNAIQTPLYTHYLTRLIHTHKSSEDVNPLPIFVSWCIPEVLCTDGPFWTLTEKEQLKQALTCGINYIKNIKKVKKLLQKKLYRRLNALNTKQENLFRKVPLSSRTYWSCFFFPNSVTEFYLAWAYSEFIKPLTIFNSSQMQIRQIST